jgi:hypothetical protein
METLSQHLATNFQVWEALALFNLGKDVKEENITRRVLDDSPDGPLYSAVLEDGAFVLRPKAGNFSQLQFIASNIFNTETKETDIVKPKIIEIKNGTKINGLAFRTSQYLESFGYRVVKMANAPTQDYQKTVVYNLTGNPDNKTAENLAKILSAELATALPDWLMDTSTKPVSPDAEALIILGQDRKGL